MQVPLGAHVEGKDGGLGSIERLMFNLQSQLVSDVVVRHGLLPKEHVVSLALLRGGEGDHVRIDLDSKEFEGSREYTEAAYKAEAFDFAAPPSVGNSDVHGIEYQLDEAQAYGAARGVAGKPMGYPGGETIVADDQQLTVLSKGTPVFDLDGQHVGNVDAASVDVATGRLTVLSLGGGIFRQSDDVPIEWIDKVGPSGITLTMRRENLEHLKAS